MSLEFKHYNIQKVGKLIKESKRKHIWKFKYNNAYYEVKALESVMSSMLRIMVQDAKIFSAKTSDDQKRRGIELEYNSLNLKFRKVSDRFDLYVNQSRFVDNTVVPTGSQFGDIKTAPIRKVQSMKAPAKKPSVDSEGETDRNTESNMGESYLVFNQDFGDSSGDEGFDNFGEREKVSSKTISSKDEDYGDFPRPVGKDAGFNINISQKNFDDKQPISMTFKKQQSGPGTSTATGRPSNDSIKNPGPPSKPSFKNLKDMNDDIDFLNFDSAPSNSKPDIGNFGQAPFSPKNAFPNITNNYPNSPRTGTLSRFNNNSNKQLTNSSRSPIDKNMGFAFDFAADNGQAVPQKKSNYARPPLSTQEAQPSNPFDAFAEFDAAPAQNIQSGSPFVKAPNQNTFNFQQNPFDDGFDVQQSLDNMTIGKPQYAQNPYQQPTPENMKSKFGNFNFMPNS